VVHLVRGAWLVVAIQILGVRVMGKFFLGVYWAIVLVALGCWDFTVILHHRAVVGLPLGGILGLAIVFGGAVRCVWFLVVIVLGIVPVIVWVFVFVEIEIEFGDVWALARACLGAWDVDVPRTVAVILGFGVLRVSGFPEVHVLLLTLDLSVILSQFLVGVTCGAGFLPLVTVAHPHVCLVIVESLDIDVATEVQIIFLVPWSIDVVAGLPD
jgi:hypothetical protein